MWPPGPSGATMLVFGSNAAPSAEVPTRVPARLQPPCRPAGTPFGTQAAAFTFPPVINRRAASNSDRGGLLITAKATRLGHRPVWQGPPPAVARATAR